MLLPNLLLQLYEIIMFIILHCYHCYCYLSAITFRNQTIILFEHSYKCFIVTTIFNHSFSLLQQSSSHDHHISKGNFYTRTWETYFLLNLTPTWSLITKPHPTNLGSVSITDCLVLCPGPLPSHPFHHYSFNLIHEYLYLFFVLVVIYLFL